MEAKIRMILVKKNFPHPTPVGKILPLSWNSCIRFHEYVQFQNVTESFLMERVFNVFCNGGGFSPSSPWNFNSKQLFQFKKYYTSTMTGKKPTVPQQDCL